MKYFLEYLETWESGAGNGISIYKAPGKTHPASCGRQNTFERRGKDSSFLFDQEKTFMLGNLPSISER